MTGNSVGQSITRVDAVGKVTGQALYPGDLVVPGMLHMKVLFARRPHARIQRLDVSKAEAAPGVVAVFTAKDVPVNEFGLIMFDAPVLADDRVRWIGEKVALVVAETEKQAARARDLIEVEYEDLPVVSDPREAMQPGAPQLHPEKENNVLIHYRIRKGDVDEAFKQADVIVQGAYHTPFQEHAFLQPEAGLAYMDDEGRVTVQAAGQWAHEDQEQIAHALGLPHDKVRVIYPAIGGAFGGREDMSVQIILALAVWRLAQRGVGRPVKIIWSREESMLAHHKRHQMFFKTRWGATKDGQLVAAEVEAISDAGAYAYTSTKVLGNTTLMCTGPYEIPNVKVDTYAVYTNNIPAGAFRGFGGPQGLFEAELQMDKLAEKLGLDPVELRMKNIIREGSILSVGTPLPRGVSMPDVAEKAAVAGGWTRERGAWQRPHAPSSDQANKRYGIGYACGFKNVGFSFGAPEQCTAKIELRGQTEIKEVIVYHAAAEVGQGTHTVLSQMAADALELPIDKIKLVVSDTAYTANSGSVSASRMTFMMGNSILGAAEVALKKWRGEERPAIGVYTYRPPKTTPYDPQTGKSEPNFAYGYVAQVAQVEVDTETGHVRVLRVWCADDVGTAVNPQLVLGQIEGGVVQAQGYAVMENLVHQGGKLQTPYLSTYLIPTVLDVPQEVNSIIMEYPDPIGPFGARGMGEMPFLPLAPAVVAAVHDATGVWFDDFPLTPDRVLKELRRANIK